MGGIDTLRRVIFEDRGTRDDGTKPAPEEGTGQVVKGRQMTRSEQAKAATGHAARLGLRRFHTARKHEGGLIHWLCNFQGRSVQGQADYAAGRTWVPPGQEHGLAEDAGLAYHTWIGVPATAMGQAWLLAAQSPAASAWAAVIFLALFIPLAVFLATSFGIFIGILAAFGIVSAAFTALAFAVSFAIVKEGKSK